MFQEYLDNINSLLKEQNTVCFYHDVDTILEDVAKHYRRKLIYKVELKGLYVKITKRFSKTS